MSDLQKSVYMFLLLLSAIYLPDHIYMLLFICLFTYTDIEF